MDRRSNEELRLRIGVREKMRDGVDQKVLEWSRDVERMSGKRLTESLNYSEVKVIRDRGMPCTSLLDGVKSSGAERCESDVH